MRALVFVIPAFALLVLARYTRYEFTPVPTPDSSIGSFYIRDRWTGSLKWCRARECYSVYDYVEPAVVAPVALDPKTLDPVAQFLQQETKK